MSAGTVHSERLGDTQLITLDRPEARNALSRALLGELAQTIEAVRGDPELRSVIITGVGVSFSAGMDLKERAQLNAEEGAAASALLRDTLAAIAAIPVPTIAAVNGFAMGGGLELALCCDLILAADTAALGLAETRWGLIPGAGGTARLPRRVGYSRAKEMIFTARPVGAAEAAAIGLVTEVFPASALREAAIRLATQINAQGPLAVRTAKRVLEEGARESLAADLSREAAGYAAVLESADRREGLAAFAQKRLPQFRGN